jgi:hypothetical protein
MDLSTSPAFQPVFIKFWQLFLQLQPQDDFVSGSMGAVRFALAPTGTLWN